MKRVIVYLLFVSAVYLFFLFCLLSESLPALNAYSLPLMCVITGGLGGVLYCLRSVYLNVSVYKRWGEEWYVWYFLRPITSAGCGAVSYIFMRAGLLVLEADTEYDASQYGFYALAFIAGLNVDKFIKKIEDVGKVVFGIEKTRSQKNDDEGGCA